MPPKIHRDPPVDQPPGYEEFIRNLVAFSADRGTPLDLQARVNGKHIDLFKLWNVVAARGGYDAISHEKLAWRRVGQEFNLGTNNAAAYAFALKTVYYKNLAAYEIKILHKREPPPREILEDITAKGGDLLHRTVENFKPPPARTSVANGADSEGSGGEESKTPKEERMEVDEPGSGGGRISRGLRQAPPQRVLFQPDVSSSRQPRHPSTHHHSSPQPAATVATTHSYPASSNPSNMSFSLANYEPRPQMPLTLRGVVTPGNNPIQFKERQRLAREAKAAQHGKAQGGPKGMMKPGAGFDGPNIYVRTLQGLRSPIPAEQDYALHHLVKISHERGDKYKFDAFPNLAESLIEYVLGVSSLFYDVKWEISYSEDALDINVLDGVNGTPDILQRIQCLKRLDTPDELEPKALAHKITKIHEAGLTIRNLSLLEDNAVYLSTLPQLRDFLTIALNLPPSPLVTELKHYALDIAEQVTRAWSMDASDPLYRSLLHQVNEGLDRGAILTALRAISRISMNLDESNLLREVPISVIKHICDWLLLEDEELVHACLDFLYQYTAVPENVAFLLANCNILPIPSFLTQLARLLQYHALETFTKHLISPAVPPTAALEIPAVPLDLLEQFLKYDEPDRSNHWLKAVFEEDSESEITQIALWQAYQARFSEFTTPQTPLLPAAEFIKNVSTIFAGANAQVVNGPNSKFIIKGIRQRHAPMDLKDRVYSPCHWTLPGTKPCGQFFLKPKHMFDHIASVHLGISQTKDGFWNLNPSSLPPQTEQPDDCYWAGCRHFAHLKSTSKTSPFDIGMHVKTHLPDISPKAALRQKHNRTPATRTLVPCDPSLKSTETVADPDPDNPEGREAKYSYQIWHNTATDERGEAAGLPLTAVLVLRNLARNIPKAAVCLKHAADSHSRGRRLFLTSGDEGEGKEGWMEKLFGPLKARLAFVLAHNRSDRKSVV